MPRKSIRFLYIVQVYKFLAPDEISMREVTRPTYFEARALAKERWKDKIVYRVDVFYKGVLVLQLI